MLDGVRAAKEAGIKVKINTVALKGVNDGEVDTLVEWCGREGHDLTFIEVMPMGDIGGENRLDQYLPISLLRAQMARRWTLEETAERTGRPGAAMFASKRPASGSASSRRLRITSANPATACG